MGIGYACIHIGSEETKLSAITLKNATDENLRLVIKKNLNALKKIIQYNIDNDIRLFRISSDIIPFGSHPMNTLDWEKEFKSEINELSAMIGGSKMRISMHPGQYTVLNSIRQDVVDRAIVDLEYHCKFLDALACSTASKIVLHVGGVYGDKKASSDSFIKNHNALTRGIKSRLVIENDDTSYNISDVLSISKETGIPVVFDVLHHHVNAPNEELLIEDWIKLAGKTWRESDGVQKIHYSQENPNGKKGAHSKYIRSSQFLDFYNNHIIDNIDIMLEVKDKNLSAIKCKLLTAKNIHIKQLEKQWAKYKYFVLSKSSSIYDEIRSLLKDKNNPAATRFYVLIDEALEKEINMGAEINAAQHVWGYISKKANPSEVKRYKKLITGYENGENKIEAVKRHLFKCAKRQDIDYLLQSLYFYILI